MLTNEFSKVFFEVDKEPIFTINEFGEYQAINGFKSIKRQDTGKVLGVVSDRYKPLNNMEVINNITNILNKTNLNYQFGKSFLSPQENKTKMEIVFPDMEIQAKNSKYDDKNQLRLFVNNNFAGKGAVTIEMGFFRLVCTNGMVVGKVENRTAVRHFSNVNNNTVKEFMSFVQSKFTETQTFIKNLTDMQFNHKSDVESIIMDNDLVAKRYKELVLNTWQDKYEGSLNGWYVLNSFTEVITHNIKQNQFAKQNTLSKLSEEANKWLELA